MIIRRIAISTENKKLAFFNNPVVSNILQAATKTAKILGKAVSYLMRFSKTPANEKAQKACEQALSKTDKIIEDLQSNDQKPTQNDYNNLKK